jgi:integrase
MHITLHKAFKSAFKTGLLSHNPIDLVEPPKVERPEMKTMTEEDISRFLNEARRGDYYSLFYIYLFTGIRRNEALALRWSDVDLLGCQLSVNKTMQFLNNKVTYKSPKTANSRRLVALSPSTCVVLRLHKRHRTKLENTKKIRRNQIKKARRYQIKKIHRYQMMIWFFASLMVSHIYPIQ